MLSIKIGLTIALLAIVIFGVTLLLPFKPGTSEAEITQLKGARWASLYFILIGVLTAGVGWIWSL